MNLVASISSIKKEAGSSAQGEGRGSDTEIYDQEASMKQASHRAEQALLRGAGMEVPGLF